MPDGRGKKAGIGKKSTTKKMKKTVAPNNAQFTAVMTDADGNVVSRRSGTLESSSVDEAFGDGGSIFDAAAKSDALRRRTPKGY